jgi:hypothetical protein
LDRRKAPENAALGWIVSLPDDFAFQKKPIGKHVNFSQQGAINSALQGCF